MKKTITLCFVLLLALPMAIQAQSSPNLAVSAETVSFGAVQPNESPHQIVLLKNTGDKVLTIKSITPSCECIIAKLSAKSIAPGKAAGLDISLHEDNAPGEFVGVVYIASNDPDEPLKAVKIYVTFVGNP